MSRITFLVIMVLISVNYVWNLQVIFERADVGYFNEKYVTDMRVNVRRYVRRGSYYLNVMGTNQQLWGNNVSISFVFYEFLHNEYKRSFVEFQFKMCDIMNKEKYIGRALLAAGLECPAPPRRWALFNISVPAHNYPNVWPFEKCRVDIKFETVPEKEHIGDLHIYLLMKQGKGI